MRSLGGGTPHLLFILAQMGHLNMNMQMQAPKGTTSAVIEGHEYSVPQSGIIKVAQEAHLETLKRHGFIDHFETEVDADEKIDAMDDKNELVTFVEEHGGEADNSMSLKKLRRLAKESLES